jgi:pentatricopeptide repeat protein
MSASSLTTTKNTRQLIREIQACRSDVNQALELLKDTKEEGPYLAALHVCGKAKNTQVALDLYRKFAKSESCRALTIAVCGKCGQYQQALKLLEQPPAPSVQSYNAAIAACGHSHAWKESLQILDRMPSELVSTFTCNAVLTALARSKRGLEAQELLKKMKQVPNYAKPDRSTYNHVIAALCKMGKLDHAHALFLEMKSSPNNDCAPNDQTYEMLITTYGKRKNWEMAHTLERERQDGEDDETREFDYFQHWNMPGMTKVGRGKYARWEFGTYQRKEGVDLTIAVHPHRNPAKNGISLLLLKDGSKLGHLIMVNKAATNTSTLLGVFVDPKERKSGYSKAFLALWLKLCLEADIQPQTGIINKPLLALVLQRTFDCVPHEGMGVEVELSPGDNNTIVLYSTTAKNLEGAFSPKDVNREGLVFAKEPTEPRGRKVQIGAPFMSPKDTVKLKEDINKILGDGTVSYKLTSHDLRRIFHGEK